MEPKEKPVVLDETNKLVAAYNAAIGTPAEDQAYSELVFYILNVLRGKKP